MASVEQLIISKIIEDASIQEAMKAGIKPIHFAAEWEDVYNWVAGFFRQHGAVPTARAFGMQFGHIELVDTSGETFSGLFEELIDAYRGREITQAISDAMKDLESDNVQQASEILSRGLQKATIETTRLRDVDIIQSWEERYNRYVEMSEQPNALRGIPTGFAGLDRITHGLRPQQFIVLAGEPKRGKSLIELIMVRSAHIAFKKPALISYEMSIDEQTCRYDALCANVDYNNILSGHLSKAELARIRRVMVERKNMHPLYISEDTTSHTTLSALAGKIQELQPDVLFVDGMYLMDDEEGEAKGSPQALTNISRGMKRIAQRFDIPVVGTTQVLGWKLGDKKSRKVTGDSLGYTSAFLQDTDLLLGVERNPDIDNQSIIRVVEARTAPRAEVHIQWNWSTMEFAEIHEDDIDDLDPSYD